MHYLINPPGERDSRVKKSKDEKCTVVPGDKTTEQNGQRPGQGFNKTGYNV